MCKKKRKECLRKSYRVSCKIHLQYLTCMPLGPRTLVHVHTATVPSHKCESTCFTVILLWIYLYCTFIVGILALTIQKRVFKLLLAVQLAVYSVYWELPLFWKNHGISGHTKLLLVLFKSLLETMWSGNKTLSIYKLLECFIMFFLWWYFPGSFNWGK